MPNGAHIRIIFCTSVKIWKIVVSVGFISALFGVFWLHNKFQVPEEKVNNAERVRHGKKAFDVPGWAFGTSLSATDYINYLESRSLILPTNRAQDISFFHAGNEVNFFTIQF